MNESEAKQHCHDDWYEKLWKMLRLEMRCYEQPDALIPILPTGTVIFAHRFRPYVRDGLRYRGRMRGTENLFTKGD